jgi:CRISPR/Cas system CMR subunit Cmr6 (Cas7 group RAMP superfamily)
MEIRTFNIFSVKYIKIKVFSNYKWKKLSKKNTTEKDAHMTNLNKYVGFVRGVHYVNMDEEKQFVKNAAAALYVFMDEKTQNAKNVTVDPDVNIPK